MRQSAYRLDAACKFIAVIEITLFCQTNPNKPFHCQNTLPSFLPPTHSRIYCISLVNQFPFHIPYKQLRRFSCYYYIFIYIYIYIFCFPLCISQKRRDNSHYLIYCTEHSPDMTFINTSLIVIVLSNYYFQHCTPRVMMLVSSRRALCICNVKKTKRKSSHQLAPST